MGRGQSTSLEGTETQPSLLAGSLWAGPSPLWASVPQAEHLWGSEGVNHLGLGPHLLASLRRLACRPAPTMGTPSAAYARCIGGRV